MGVTGYRDWGERTEDAVAAALEAYDGRTSGLAQVAGRPVFAHVFPRKDQLLIVGAGHISVALVRYAQVLDLETVVIDPRQVFAAPERFAVAELGTPLSASRPSTDSVHSFLCGDVRTEYDLNSPSAGQRSAVHRCRKRSSPPMTVESWKSLAFSWRRILSRESSLEFSGTGMAERLRRTG